MAVDDGKWWDVAVLLDGKKESQEEETSQKETRAET